MTILSRKLVIKHTSGKLARNNKDTNCISLPANYKCILALTEVLLSTGVFLTESEDLFAATAKEIDITYT